MELKYAHSRGGREKEGGRVRVARRQPITMHTTL